jgi:hypothetical protein
MKPGGTRPPTAAEHAAMHGSDHYGPPDRAMAVFELATAHTLARWAGIEPEVAAFKQALESEGSHRLIMRIARRSNLPFSEVRDRWSTEDLAAELAQDILAVEDQADRCPNCHVHPKEVLDENYRELERGMWKWVLHTCWFCDVGRRAERDLSEEEQKAGASYRVAHRAPGDPLKDDGDQ